MFPVLTSYLICWKSGLHRDVVDGSRLSSTRVFWVWETPGCPFAYRAELLSNKSLPILLQG